ncbi:MAG TPA: hypothetical protein VK465_05320, partial [Fibrobacteria bacterium]|nr:hypothetical protein [Fibrobacteria bacterium]
MNDVLLAYLRSRRQTQGAGAATAVTATTPATAAAESPEKAPFHRPTLPYPLSTVVALVDSHREYSTSCRQLAEFLKKISGPIPLEQVLLQVIQARLPRVWMERFLLILLEVQPSDRQTAAYALQFRHVRRLLHRVDSRKRLNAAEGQLAREMIQALNLEAFQDLDAHCARAVEAFHTVQAHRPAPSGDLGLLIWLLRCETTAMGERKRWLEGELLPAHPDAIARLTPHLKLLEDRIQRALELSQRLGRYEGPRETPMGLEETMGPFFFAHLRECLGKHPELEALRDVVELQRTRLVPTRDLTALATLFRWIQEARGLPSGPLDWIRPALMAWDSGHFRVDVAGALPAIEPLLAEARVEVEGTVATGNFGESPYTTWVA